MDAISPSLTSSSGALTAGRISGVLFGFGNQVLFLITVWYLFWFLRDGRVVMAEGDWILRDCGLAVLFAVAHSVMLVPRTRQFLTRWIPPAFYDSTFCVVTCVSLLVMFFAWRTSETVIWRAEGLVASVIHGCFYLSWAALMYSLALTGLGYQNGWTPFYHWLRQEKPPRREFKPRGAYQRFRHPVYLSFLGLVWFTPLMTLDHAALTAIWTAYIFLGSSLKDRRLTYYIGQPYRQYAARVPAYPLVGGFWRLVSRRGQTASGDGVTAAASGSDSADRARIAA